VTLYAISEWWTVSADLGVAVGTGLLALFTWRVAGRTGRLADETHALGVETRTLASETAEDVRSGVRPALIDTAGQSEPPQIEVGGGKDSGTLRLAVRNAGRGPALNVAAYALVATKAFDKRTPLATVGNVVPGEQGLVLLLGVWNTDTSGSTESYLAVRVVIFYSDLGGRRYHSVVRLTDPRKGQRRHGDRQWAPLTQEGTEVGVGEAPPPQWWVSFYGKMTDEQRAQLRANAIQSLAAHAIGSAGSLDEIPDDPAAWTYCVMVSAETRDEAIGRVQGALDDGAFGQWSADPWTSEPLTLPTAQGNSTGPDEGTGVSHSQSALRE
jgi:hypothetical protein